MQSERRAAQEALREKVAAIVEPRRCVHLKLPAEVHQELRIFAIKNKLSLQEMITEMCRLLIDGDNYLYNRMLFLSKKKKEKQIKKISVKDEEDIYNHIVGNE
jgi:hypothetical protein